VRIRTLAVALSVLAMMTATAPAVAGGPPTPTPTPTAATQRSVTFVADGTTTYGTLQVPVHRPGQRLAAALLLPGSGDIDRNGDVPPSYTPHTLALLADVLAGEGVMTLRFDKYFTGRTGGGAYAAHPEAYDLSAQIRQAAAAYRLLSAQPEADPGALLVLGHSEGGLSALLVAESARPRPAGLALLEPQDMRYLDHLRDQLGRILDAGVAAGQISRATAVQNRNGFARAVAQFRAGQPVDIAGLLPPVRQLFAPVIGPRHARFTRSDDAIYPPAVAARLAPPTRVLVTCGTDDFQVPCSTTPPLVAALRRAGTARPGLAVLPGIDHYLHTAGTPVNTPVLAPAVITALRMFVGVFVRVAGHET
jgi:pimeloyl-ACP methyl ester carboxylesterase